MENRFTLDFVLDDSEIQVIKLIADDVDGTIYISSFPQKSTKEQLLLFYSMIYAGLIQCGASGNIILSQIGRRIYNMLIMRNKHG